MTIEEQKAIRENRRKTLKQIQGGELKACEVLHDLKDFPHMRKMKVYKFIAGLGKKGEQHAYTIMLECDFPNSATLEKLTARQKNNLAHELTYWELV